MLHSDIRKTEILSVPNGHRQSQITTFYINCTFKLNVSTFCDTTIKPLGVQCRRIYFYDQSIQRYFTPKLAISYMLIKG